VVFVSSMTGVRKILQITGIVATIDFFLVLIVWVLLLADLPPLITGSVKYFTVRHSGRVLRENSV
jgi:hypothetical protein